MNTALRSNTWVAANVAHMTDLVDFRVWNTVSCDLQHYAL